MARAPQLVISLDRGCGVPLSRQIYEQIRHHVLSGLLEAGDAIPPSRTLAEQLSVSRTVIVQAYEQLQCEGFLVCARGSGTFVSGEVSTIPSSDNARELVKNRCTAVVEVPEFLTVQPSTPPPEDQSGIRYDFRHGMPAWDHFPLERWRRLLVRAFATAGPATLGYGPAEGSPALRQEIARLLRHTRRVAASEDRVLITTGATQALDLVSRVLLSKGDIALVEDPAHPVLRDIFRFAGATVVPVPVDDEGLRVHDIGACLAEYGIRDPLAAKSRLVYVTPSHQFPSGVTMSLRRKIELLHWTQDNNAFVVEDDYDSEYRFDGPRISALAGLDEVGRVIYVGTFSKVLFPALRIGYVCLPRFLVQPFVTVKWLADRLTPTLEQETLATFIRSGHYASHVRRMTRVYTSRRLALVTSLQEEFGSRVAINGVEAGLHVLVSLESDASEAAIASRAETMGVRVYPASPYYLRPPPGPARFLLGYGALSEKQIRAGIRLLRDAERAAACRP